MTYKLHKDFIKAASKLNHLQPQGSNKANNIGFPTFLGSIKITRKNDDVTVRLRFVII